MAVHVPLTNVGVARLFGRGEGRGWWRDGTETLPARYKTGERGGRGGASGARGGGGHGEEREGGQRAHEWYWTMTENACHAAINTPIMARASTTQERVSCTLLRTRQYIRDMLAAAANCISGTRVAAAN